MRKLGMAVIASVVLAACGGGGGNGAKVGGLTHNQLAQNFVNALNNSGQIGVTLVKSDTDQYNYIVVYDGATDQYIAIDIGTYQPNSDAYAYWQSHQSSAHFDLDVIPGYYVDTSHWETTCDINNYCTDYYVNDGYSVPTKYRDRRADITFEKVAATPKDLEKMAAMKDAATMALESQKLQTQFGLSAERSDEVARLTQAWQKAGGKDLTNAEHDAFSKEVLGFTITEAKAAANSSDASSIDSLINKPAATNGISPENVKEIMKNFMN